MLYYDLYADIMLAYDMHVNVELAAVKEKIGDAGHYQPDANDQRQLRPREKILEVWSEPLSREHLQVFVSLRAAVGSTPQMSESFMRRFAHRISDARAHYHSANLVLLLPFSIFTPPESMLPIEKNRRKNQ